MKPPNVTPPPAATAASTVVVVAAAATQEDQQLPTASSPTGAEGATQQTASKQLHPTTPVDITTSSPSQQTANLNDENTTSTTPTASATTTTTITTNNSPPVATSMALITIQPTIVTKPAAHTTTIAATTNPAITTASPIPLNATVVNASQEQQAPLALTTQNQTRAQLQLTPNTASQIQVQQLSSNSQQITSATTAQIVSITSASNTSTTQSSINPQLGQIQSKQANQLNTTISTTSPITLAAAPTSAGQTALVIIPQNATGIPGKAGTITAKTTQIPTTFTTTAAHIALTSTTQPSALQMQAPVATIVANMAPVPMTAHQNNTLVNRPPQTLPVVPLTTATNISTKHEPNRHTCCLFDNGIRCDRVAGNASFSARIQKIVGTKKMNFSLDQSARHSYICDHHKAIITVAKKMTTPARETKANARNYTANNNANTPLASQHTNNFNDLALNQSTMQHQVNLDMLSNQSRLANNHAAVLNTMPMRPGAQIAYGHYPGPHTNQMGSMDTMMTSGFDSTGGDSIPSGSGGVDVDLQQLQVNTLRRYKRHFRVQTRPGLNKMQLAESLKHHFRTLPIIEKEAITYFVYIVKCSRNKLDHNPKAD